ncbi:MAG TPA: MFS transporter [Nocardioides sp.]|jgi:EmrB/QacA subfamily drug resistance transporter|uniref:MFS transporter n=1 Tax=Nocardioides sp. TaxID=35761 RepID=UPI002E3132AE|nr:MFS transporter [Nocardioides sp.]HEX3929317.1 MFS transporter [Nocardioides sp.]
MSTTETVPSSTLTTTTPVGPVGPVGRVGPVGATLAGQLAGQLAGHRKHLALVAMLFAVSMTFIDQTIVAIASPSIQSQLDLSRTGTQWVVNAYLLALAATFALGGRLADVIGSRRMVLLGISGFAVTSALCGLTPHGHLAEPWIVGFRILQGISGALMIPAALAVVVAAFPVAERGRALALFFGVSGGLTAVGPIAGGYLTQWTWRAIFWINIPIAILALVLTACAGIPSVRRAERIDLRGAALVALGMGLSVLGFEQAAVWGWRSPLTWGSLVAGVAVLAVFAAVELRTKSPLVRLRIFAAREFVVDNLVLFLAMVAFVPTFFFASVYAQVSLGYDANRAGLYLLMFFGGFAPAAQLGGRMLDRSGARRPMVLGSALGATGFALWAQHLHEYSLGAQWPYLLMAGAGIGLLLGPASTDAVNRAIDASYGEVTGITQTVRNYASSLGLAVLGTVLTTVLTGHLTSSLVGLGVPHSQAAQIAGDAARGGSPRPGSTPPAIADHLHAVVVHDFATATQGVLYGMAIALGLALLAALRYPRRSH